jgi:hypothetical protein
MKIKINESQYRKLLETITNDEEKKFIGKKVMVYRNLHKDTFSIQYKSRIVLYADYVKLNDVEFRVRPGGNEKVGREKKKNVHAFVIGDLEDYCEYPCGDIPNEPNDNIVTYDPYKYKSFVIKSTNEPIYNANEVEMINSKNKIFITKL